MPSLPPLSVQLWSVREQLEADLPRTLDRLAAIGFTRIEPFDLFNDAEGLAAAMAASGLSAPSAHASLTTARSAEEVFDAATRLGVGIVVDPMTPEVRWQTADGIGGIADELGAAAELAAAYGLVVGYHNHAFEVATTVDGRHALELFAKLVDRRVVLEVDAYWAAVGGADVPALIGRLGERVQLLHLKDGPYDMVDVHQVPIGSGRLPVWEIVDAATALRVPIIEFDGYAGDMFEGLTAAFAYATAGPVTGGRRA